MTGPSASDAARDHVLHSLTMRLTYADCDPAGILYFAAWFPWMERLQSEWFYLNDLRQDTLGERFGFSTVTRHTECEYLAQVGLFATIDLELFLAHIGKTSLVLKTSMWWREGATTAARGTITIVCLGPEGTPITVPDRVKHALAPALQESPPTGIS